MVRIMKIYLVRMDSDIFAAFTNREDAESYIILFEERLQEICKTEKLTYNFNFRVDEINLHNSLSEIIPIN